MLLCQSAAQERFVVTVLASAVLVPLASSREFYLHFVSLSDKRSYPAGAPCTVHTAPASQSVERRIPGKAGLPSEWVCCIVVHQVRN